MAAGLAAAPQRPASGLERLVAQDAARHLEHERADVRGEAALIVAATLAELHEPTLLAMAAAPQPDARRRALLAAGIAATPRSVALLERRLLAHDGRTADDAPFAAFALGLVPPDRAGSSAARVLATFPQGSFRRQQDALLALTAGLARSTSEPRQEATALRLLFDDDSNREPESRAALLGLLLPCDPGFGDAQRRRVLERGSDAERLVLLRFLADEPTATLQPWLDDLVQLVERTGTPSLRAAALDALSQARHLPALDLAARALRSAAPDECAAGLRALQTIGGIGTRRALEQHLLAERRPAVKAALLGAYGFPPSDALSAHCRSLAADREAPLPLRTAATLLVARSDGERMLPLLRDLFRASNDPDALQVLGRELLRHEPAAVDLSRVLPAPPDLALHPEHWCALLHAGHAAAERRVLVELQRRDGDADRLHTTLACWRSAIVLAPPPHAPEPVRELLR